MTIDKIRIGMIITILGQLAVVFSHCPSCLVIEGISPVKKMLIDTDAGGDDAVGIIMVTGAERLGDGPEIIGITCVNGNTGVKQVARNVLKTLQVVDRLDIPVFVGASAPLLIPASRDYYFGQDGFGDFEFPDPPSTDLIQPEHAVNAMVDLVKKSPGEITILALGPLTNIALAIKMHPTFLDDVQQLIIMGGSTEGRGNALPGIEFNFFADPHANYIVFNQTTTNPVTLVPLETTRKAYLKMPFRRSLDDTNNRRLQLINKAGASTLREDVNWYSADAVATAAALEPKSVITKSDLYYSEAIYEGKLTAGMIIVDYTNITGHEANTNLIEDVNRDAFERMFIRYFG